jgi:hypothetical protein
MTELGKKVDLRHPESSVAIYVLVRTTANVIDQDFSSHLQQVPALIENEINATVGNAQPGIEYLLQRKSAIEMLLTLKSEELNQSNQIASAFYGNSPLNHNPVDFVNTFFPRTSSATPEEVFRSWIASYTAAHGVILLTEAIRVLHDKAASVGAEIEVAQAQLAAAYAQQQAEEQQRRRAEEQRVVEEKNRLEAEAAAIRVANTYQLSASIAVTQPLFLTASGAIALAENAAITLQAAIRAAIAGLTTAAGTIAAGLFVGVSALIYSPKLGNGELPQSYSFSTPLSDILPDNKEDLHAIAAAGGSIELPFRLSSKAGNEGDSELIVVNTSASGVSSSVKVISATHNPENNTYSVQTTDNPTKTLIWTPAETPASSSTTLPSEEQGPTVIPGSSITPIEGRIDTFPQVAEITLNDLIIVFPIDSGLAPIYVMFKDRREEPGTVTGNGEPVGERWLRGVSAGEGATIPSQIADRMRGKEFNNFKGFREEFWKAIGSNPDLARQFTPQNIAHLLKGRGPVARRADWIGGRTKLEIHHHIPLSSGGKLYDLDNLRITTPKLHISIHNAGKDHDQ